MNVRAEAALSFAFLVALVPSAVALGKLPAPWEMIGVGRSLYESGIETDGGRASARLRCDDRKAELPGVLARVVPAADYRGKVLRYGAALKYWGVKRQVGLWMWVLDSKRRVIASEFMDDEQRLLKGSGDWKRHEIGIRVPKNAETLVFGLRLWGQGEASVRDMTLETSAREHAGTWKTAGLSNLL
ncbi:MAG: hypothetical protein HY403_08720 [Elusimicrobia bacterium]|nr:hypothetical protein [Elusimicrobiota bacterium]